jgi:chemotaxis protein MotB
VRPDFRRTLGLDVAPPDDDQTGWLLTFSDLVLQLFAFVLVSVVLASASPPPAPPQSPAHAEQLAGGPPPDATNERLAAAGRSLRQFVAAEGRGDAVEVTVRDRDLVVTLNDAITFLSGSADLLPEGAPILRRIGTLARAMPDFDLEVDGHTDDVPIHTGTFPSNLELSLARAARVAHELTVEAPELGDRTIAAGYGELRPAASNADETGRARNRRVEVRFLPHAAAG